MLLLFPTAGNTAGLILRLFYDLELLRFRLVTLLSKLQLTVSELNPPFHLLPNMLTIPDHLSCLSSFLAQNLDNAIFTRLEEERNRLPPLL